MKTKPTPCLSSLPATAVAWPSVLPDSRRFMLPPPSLQPCYSGKKAMAQQKCKRTDLLKFSPEEKMNNKTFRDPVGKMKQVLRFNIIEHNSSDGSRSEQEDGCGQGCAMLLLLLLLLRHSFVSLGPVKKAFTRALSQPPSSQRWQDRPGRGGYFYPLSIQVLTRISYS